MATINISTTSSSYAIPYSANSRTGQGLSASSTNSSQSALQSLDEHSRSAKSDLLVEIKTPQSVTVSTTLGHKRSSGGLSRDEAIALYLQVAQYL